MAKAKKEKQERSAEEVRAEVERNRLLQEGGWTVPLQASGGEITPWETGKVVIGKFRGMKKLPDKIAVIDGEQVVTKRGHLFTIQTAEALEVFGAPTMLYHTIRNVPLGAMLRIECIGQVVETQHGTKAWDFLVSAKDQRDLFSGDGRKGAVEPDDDES